MLSSCDVPLNSFYHVCFIMGLTIVIDNDRYWHPFKADLWYVMLTLMYMNKMILTKYMIVPQNNHRSFNFNFAVYPLIRMSVP